MKIRDLMFFCVCHHSILHLYALLMHIPLELGTTCGCTGAMDNT